jgi:hypothetical protein
MRIKKKPTTRTVKLTMNGNYSGFLVVSRIGIITPSPSNAYIDIPFE